VAVYELKATRVGPSSWRVKLVCSPEIQRLQSVLPELHLSSLLVDTCAYRSVVTLITSLLVGAVRRRKAAM